MPLSEAATSALISGGSAILSGGAQAISAGKMNRRAMKNAREQRAWNEAMADKQNDWSMNMWNLTNEYNDPSHVRQRLIDAGINPLSQDLTGNTATGMSSAQTLGYQQPTYQNPYPDLVQNALNSAALIAQIKNVEANTKKTEVDTDLQAIQLEIKNATKGNEIALSDVTLTGSRLNNEKIQSDIAKTKFDIEQAKKDFNLKCAEYDLKTYEFDFKVAQQNIENYFKSQNFTLAEKQLALQTFNASIQAKYAESNIALNERQALYIDAQTGRLTIENDRSEAQLEAEKPLMKFNAYVDSGLRVVSGLLDCVNIANFFKPKAQSKDNTHTVTQHYDGKGRMVSSVEQNTERY